MVRYGADVNATNKHNITPLMHACENGDVDAINILLNAGANPNIADIDGYTSLHNAVEGLCSTETLKAIIDHGADVNASNKANETALLIACRKRNIDAMKVLLHSEANPNIADVKGDTLLHSVIQNHLSNETLQSIIDHGVDVNAINNDGESALLLACKTGQKISLSLLLRSGADPNIVDIYDDTCLHKVVNREYDQETLQMFLDHGAPVNATNKNHETAYMLACDQGNIDAMFALLKAGADPGINSNDDCDANLHHTDDGCSIKVTLQKGMQRLNPAWQYLYEPELNITESLSFNIASRIICNMLRHIICWTKGKQ